MKILITGGPVHGKIDDVKIVTNKFKGGLIAELADQLAEYPNVDITYLTTKDSSKPKNEKIKILYHDGIYDYMNIVLAQAPKMNAVVLGAAIANLIPKTTIKGKFPSHNYKEGDSIPIEFIIAPRIIDKVKAVAPNAHLFGFKLLSNVDFPHLVDAAYDIVLQSKATTVFANDLKDLNQIFMISKDKSIHPMKRNHVADQIIKMTSDKYYKTVLIDEYIPADVKSDFADLIAVHKHRFTHSSNNLMFGSIAMRYKDGFICTGRGKNELEDFTFVSKVDMSNRIVYAIKKSALNTPLINKIFQEHPEINVVIHTHNLDAPYLVQEYAIPGTVRDTERDVSVPFIIDKHGDYTWYGNDE